MARAFGAELTALYVETSVHEKMSAQSRIRLKSNRKLAEQSGARFASSYGNDVALQIAEYAKACGATKIVIGRPNNRKKSKSDIPQRLMQLVPELEIYIIPHNASSHPEKLKKRRAMFSGRSMLVALGILCAATLLGLLLQRTGFAETNIILVYILSVLLISYLTEGYLYGIAASILSVFVFNFLFTEPRFTFMAYDAGYPLTFFVMFTASILTSSLTVKVREESKSNAQKAYRTEVLLTASRNLQHAESEDEILSETATQIMKLLGRPVILYPVRGGALQKPFLLCPNNFDIGEIDGTVCEAERSIAESVYQNNEQAGATTRTEPTAKFWYLAVRGNDEVHAVAGIFIQQGERLSEFERDLLLTLLGECGVAMEKQRLRESQTALAVAAQREKLRADLLRAISHDLRTPLTTISGNAEILMGDRVPLDDRQKHMLYTDIYEDSTWLISLVENLLSITRIDNKTLALSLKPELISDLIDEAVTYTEHRAKHHHLCISLENELLMVKVDATLIIHVLVNLIDNAVKYTPEGSNIAISAMRKGDNVLVSIADDGPGIPDDIQPKLFEMFYTYGSPRSDARRGLGIGLALCRSIIAAHGGEIWVSDHVPQGAVFTFSLPGEEGVSNA
ncbi:MAG: DUF4118 domain-containing protein [Oscillospiraceae bacterium]|nr:DUF4118 domain-containing protein [Oscillospiraceae bacterium]